MNEFITEGALSFNDENHLNNHLNYLFRTDKAQKWTNEYTEENELFTFNKEGKLESDLLDDPKERQMLKDGFFEALKTYPLDKLRTVRMECKNDEYSFTEDMYTAMIIPMMDLHKIFPVILFVTHVDQLDNYCHYHAIIYVR